MQNKKNNDKAGYTIIETMIAVSLFIIIVMMGMGALLNANLIHQKSQSMRSIIDNLSFTMEDMSRNLRTGLYYYCITSSSLPPLANVGVGYTQDCTDKGGISFQTASGVQWIYFIDNNPNITNYHSIFRRINGVTVQLTPDEVNITSASIFSVFGANPPPDNRQPFVTIKLVGTITFKNVVTPFSLQTSVSQRQIDI